jgi:hypothetical protein
VEITIGCEGIQGKFRGFEFQDQAITAAFGAGRGESFMGEPGDPGIGKIGAFEGGVKDYFEIREVRHLLLILDDHVNLIEIESFGVFVGEKGDGSDSMISIFEFVIGINHEGDIIPIFTYTVDCVCDRCILFTIIFCIIIKCDQIF